MDDIEFRRVMGHFATGVTVVTATSGAGVPHGLTANAISSVSLDPTLVLVCVERTADTEPVIREAGAFAINILPEERGEVLARRFAEVDTGDRFSGVAHRPGSTGAPILERALAWLDCTVHEELPGGDHTIFLGRVVAGDADEGTPLVYYRGGYGRFQP
jgi:flavin reductase (DIM6/NTAB) family NADH-FMN oxidoreductase RutF